MLNRLDQGRENFAKDTHVMVISGAETWKGHAEAPGLIRAFLFPPDFTEHDILKSIDRIEPT